MSYREELEQKYGTCGLGTVDLTDEEKRGLWLEERASMDYLPYGDSSYAYCSAAPSDELQDMWFDADGKQLQSPASYID